MTSLNIDQFIPEIQNWINDNVKSKVTSKEIYESLVKDGIIPESIRQPSFSAEFSLSVKVGNIVGVKGQKGRYGGFFPEVTSVSQEPREIPEMPKKETFEQIIYIDEDVKVQKVDSKNYQVTVGNRVMYASTLKDSFKLLSCRLLEKEVTEIQKSSAITLLNAIKQAEENIIAKLENVQ